MRALVFLALTLSAGSAAAAVPSGCQEDYATCKEDCSIEYGGRSQTLKKLTRCIADCQESLDLCANRHSSLKDLPPGVAGDSRPSRRAEPSRKKAKKDEEDPFGDEAPAPRKKSGEDDPFGDERPANAKGGADRRESYRASESRREEVPPAPEPAPAPGSRSRGTSSRAEAEATVLGTSAEGSKRSGYRASDTKPAPEKSLGLEDLESEDAKPEPAPEPVAKPAPPVASSREEKAPLLDEEPTVLPAPPPTRKPTTTTKAPARETKPPEPKKDISEWDPNGD